MNHWEYLTVLLEANTEVTPVPIRDDIPAANTGRYTPYSLIPQLNFYGSSGWELVSIEPVCIGRNGDVVKPDASSAKWARHWFCAFKRNLPGDA